MARVTRHKHHSRKSRSNWAVMGAFVASAAFAPRLRWAAHASGSRTPARVVAHRGAWRDAARARAGESGAGRRPASDAFRHSSRTAPHRPRGDRAHLRHEHRRRPTPRSPTSPRPGCRACSPHSTRSARAIDGTSVTSRSTGPNSVSLEIRLASEAVDVTGTIPQPRPSSPIYSQPLIEVPQTIEVIPRAAMEAQGVTTLSEALRNVPGISLQAGEGGGASNTSGDMFNLRGFSASNSLFVDGVRDDGLMSRDVYNLEQIEVFMGPTGSDVGRGNAAGYVNMQTKAPLAESAYARELRLRQRRCEPYDGRSQSGAHVRCSRQLAWPQLVAAECTLGRRRRLRPGLRVAQQQVDRPIDRPGPEHRNARHGSGSDHTAGQPARLRNSRFRVVRDATCTDDGDRDEPGRSGKFLRQRRTRISTRSRRKAIPAASSTTSTAT